MLHRRHFVVAVVALPEHLSVPPDPPPPPSRPSSVNDVARVAIVVASASRSALRVARSAFFEQHAVLGVPGLDTMSLLVRESKSA